MSIIRRVSLQTESVARHYLVAAKTYDLLTRVFAKARAKPYRAELQHDAFRNWSRGVGMHTAACGRIAGHVLFIHGYDPGKPFPPVALKNLPEHGGYLITVEPAVFDDGPCYWPETATVSVVAGGEPGKGFALLDLAAIEPDALVDVPDPDGPGVEVELDPYAEVIAGLEEAMELDELSDFSRLDAMVDSL